MGMQSAIEHGGFLKKNDPVFFFSINVSEDRGFTL